jgi:glycosyltransferase involved in cell wall biosynthesis
MTNALHLVFWHPTPYHAYLLRSLAADPEIDLTAHFVEKSLASHPWQTDMTFGYRSRCFRKILGLDGHLLRLTMHERESFFMIFGWNEPTMIMMVNMLGMLGRPFAFWTDTPNIDSPRSPFKAVPRAMWLKWAFKRASFVMGTGRPALTALSQMGCPEFKLVNFPTFVDLRSFSPCQEAAGLNKNMTIFLSSGRLINSIKGYDLALNALAKVRDDMGLSGDAFKYRLAGSGPDLDALSHLARRLGLSDQVEFLGWLEPSKLPEFYRSGQVLLHPSHIDNYANAVIEGMASGLTVIGSDHTGAVVDRIKPGHNGLIHQAGDLEDLASKIAFVLAHPEEVAAMGAQARTTSEEWPASRAVSLVKSMIHGAQNK